MIYLDIGAWVSIIFYKIIFEFSTVDKDWNEELT
jgi:hypothetical protein